MGTLRALPFLVILPILAMHNTENEVRASQADCMIQYKRVLTNDFFIGRGLKDYFVRHHPELSQVLSGLKKNQKVLDAGAGLGEALADYLRLHEIDFYLGTRQKKVSVKFPDLRSRAKAIALGVKKPKLPEHVVELEKQGNLQYVERTLQEYADLHPGSMDLIMDTYGAATYSSIDTVIKANARLLKPGGKAFFSMQWSEIRDSATGQRVSAKEFLKLCRGFSFDVSSTSGQALEFQDAIVITRTSGEIYVPKLTMSGTISNGDGPITLYYITQP